MSQPVHVFPDRWIVEDLGLKFHFFRQFPAKSHFFLKRIKIDSPSDVAVADLFRIFLLVLGETQMRGQRRQEQDKPSHAQPAPH
ncbi:MAG: hypothetical protein DMG58_23490 [Acidobacteria bacterium]|nr:MAG: hypothetical protein DMG58_23490 [Acidobacteriota bacterium]